MKVVLIAESEDTIKEYSSFLEEAGADVITYRWFLKALDNLTEIQPHIIIVSALDFPRHWKTLFTHIEAGEVKTQPLVYLITDPSFTASEKKKAMFLGAQDIFNSPLTNRDKNSLLSMLPAGMGIETPVTSPVVVQEPVSAPVEPEVSGEYAELKAQAESQGVAVNKIHNISAAEANAFELIDSEISNINPTDDDIQEVSEDGISEPEESLVIEGAEEDILSTLEEEMTESVPSDEPASAPEPVSEAPDSDEVPIQEAVVSEDTSLPEKDSEAQSFTTEPVPSVVPERPEQITWSAPVDEADSTEAVTPQAVSANEVPSEDEVYDNGDSVQFSFVNPRSGLVVTGTVESYEHPVIKFVPSSKEVIEGIRFGQILDQCKFTFEGETIKARAQIRGLGKAIEFCLLY